MIIDNSNPIEFPVPDTGGWEDFKTTDISLPALSAGKHTFKITSVVPHSTTNLDCFILYQGLPNSLPPALRTTVLAKSQSNRFVIKATPRVILYTSGSDILNSFERIYDYFKNFMGWEPPTPVAIHIFEDDKWPDPNASSFQNNAGVFFRASRMATDEGNWCHEMTHMFYVAHFPWWFDESSVQVLTTFEWMPVLFRYVSPPETNQLYKQWTAEGKDVLQYPNKTYDSVNPIHYALVVKFGPKIFSRFFHLCNEAGEKGQLDFAPGHHLKRDQIVKYMLLAAGQDVTSLYQQWTGFATAE